MSATARNRATFRFYAELNDFVPGGARRPAVEHAFAGTPSVKDVIERLGVPHTEVDLILVDGVAVDFAYRVADGDRVSVYPAFARLDVCELTRLRPAPPPQTRYLADAHLGTLCRYLRLLGFDTAFDTRWADPELAGRSASEQRILLTRDRRLLMRRVVTHGMFVRDDDPAEQLTEVARRLHPDVRLRPFTRCMGCNGVLEDVEKARVLERLEPGTRRTYDEFRHCADCGRVYWKGAHHARLLGLVARAEAARRSDVPVRRTGEALTQRHRARRGTRRAGSEG